jgi:hypothetical protein
VCSFVCMGFVNGGTPENVKISSIHKSIRTSKIQSFAYSRLQVGRIMCASPLCREHGGPREVVINGSTGRGKKRGEPVGSIDLPMSGQNVGRQRRVLKTVTKLSQVRPHFVTTFDAVI